MIDSEMDLPHDAPVKRHFTNLPKALPPVRPFLEMQGRKVKIPFACARISRGVARFTFEDLCVPKKLWEHSPTDYLIIGQHFLTVFCVKAFLKCW
jgi:predicted ATPase